MVTPDIRQEDHDILKALALAMVQDPRASLQDLAKAIGISKATLYRFCRTREELIDRLLAYGIKTVGETIEAADLTTAPPLDALRRLTEGSFKNREVSAFLTHYWKPQNECPAEWNEKMDALFLRGQQEGVFRIDIPAAALTEIWVALVVGLTDAEYRGRIARAGLTNLVEHVLLQGVSAK